MEQPLAKAALVAFLLAGCIHECPEECVLVERVFEPAHTETVLVPDCSINWEGEFECGTKLDSVYVPDRWYIVYEGKVSGGRKRLGVSREVYEAPPERKILTFFRSECPTGEVPTL